MTKPATTETIDELLKKIDSFQDAMSKPRVLVPKEPTQLYNWSQPASVTFPEYYTLSHNYGGEIYTTTAINETTGQITATWTEGKPEPEEPAFNEYGEVAP